MTTTGGSSVFVDTNVLVYATTQTSPWHTPALNYLQAARATSVELVISSQILREYIAVTTKLPPSGSGLTTAEALKDFRLFRSQFRMLQESDAVLDALDNLMQTFSITSRQIYDANIVATMQTYGITQLLTHNVADFTRFAGLITVVPLVSTTP